MGVAGKVWRALPPRAVLLVALSGLAVTAALCVFQVSSNNADTEAAFRRIAQERLSATQQRYDSNLANQEGVNALFRASDEVTLSEFRLFVEQPRATPWRYRAIEWAAPVDGAQRTAFETKAAAPTRDRRADGAYVAATERPVYFPVTHVWPQAGNEKQRGFDLAGDAARFDALQRAIDSARPVVTAPVPLPTRGEDRSAYLVVIPSYTGDAAPASVEDRRERLKGVSVGVYQFGDNLSDMLAQSQSEAGQHILIYASYVQGALPTYVHVARKSGNEPLPDPLESLTLTEASTLPGAYVGQVRLANLGIPFVFLSAHPIGGLAGFRWLTLGVILAGLAGTLSLSLLVWRRERLVANARRAETVHRAILATSNDAFIQFDRNGKIVDWSPVAETMFGLPRADALGTNFCALFASAEERAALVASREKFIEIGRPRTADRVRQLTALRSDGAEFPVELMVGDGRIDDEWHFFGFIRDVSARKQADARLARAEKLEALGQLTGGIAHDFNNLLGIIVGNLDLALELGRIHGETRNGLGVALAAAMRGKELIRSLLTVARRQAVVPEAENANQILTEMLPLLCNSAGAGIEVEFAPCEGEAMTRIERSGFEAALINLVVNARDAMPKGGTIRLQTAWRDVDTAFLDRENVAINAGRYLVVSAHDDGVGMTPEIASRAFDPFFTTKELGSAGGAGLGLAMVYGFAKQSGGGATIESEPGHGTTVRLYLPAAEAVELAA